MTVAAPKTRANNPTAAPRPGQAPFRLTLDPKPLIALTRDARLLATLKRVSGTVHPVRVVGSEVDLSAALMTHQAGVAVLDCTAVVSPIATLTERLHAQFPDLVLIVAGSADEQGRLTTQIADGSVHRFLHKPVSEQRVRLFVEAAWRRHAEDDGVLRAVRAAVPLRPAGAAKWWVGLGVVLIAGGTVLWFFARTPESSPHEANAGATPGRVSTPAASSDDGLMSLLARADQALAAGALVAPPEENAAALYRAALRRNARDPRAVNGLEQVIERLLAGAEEQLQQQHLEAAQRLADEARANNPAHPRVAFLEAQIGAQRERAVLGKAQRAAAGGNVAGALAALDDAARAGGPAATEAHDELAQKQVDSRVAEYLSRGRDALSRGRLIEPLENNARFYIESARALAPSDPAVQQASGDLIARLESEARKALAARNPEGGDMWASAAADAGAAPATIAALHEEARQLRSAAREASLAHLSQAFNQSLEQGHLTEPATDSAQFYLAQLTQADAVNPTTQLARGAYRTRVLDEARNALGARDFTGAHRWLAEARAAGADAADLSALDAALTHTQDEAQQASTYVNESTLTRTRYVPPQFPEVARQRGIDGWVDLQFLVGTDGAVGDIKVVGAQPAGIFEQSALDAVRRWRYQPAVRDGHNVSQRARVRLRFAVQR